MKSLIVLSVICRTLLPATAAVDVRVCDPNDLHPLGINEVMLGTQVSLLVYSDANDLWSGGLFIHDEDRGKGILDYRLAADPNDPNEPLLCESCLDAAGHRAFIMTWNDSQMSGLDLYTGEYQRSEGNWFIVDYTPLAEGNCTVYFYDHAVSFTVPDPNMQISLFNSPTRDWNGDEVVNYRDYAVLASMWAAQNCADPNWCNGTDLNRDGAVDLIDLVMFADFWLWGTPNWQRTTELPAPPDPNVFYAIVDPNGLNELWIPVGQSIQLYLDKTTLNENVYVFSLEVTLSDPNLGWIDNTPIDPNDPYGGGTAEILATPRTSSFDYWGTGNTQDEGIRFLAFSLGGAMNDGSIASFVYTPTQEGTVTLELVDLLENGPVGLSPILLHQYIPELQMMMAGDPAETGDLMTAKSAEELVEKLEEVWEESPQLQESIEEERWDNFIEAVKDSAEAGTLNYYQ